MRSRALLERGMHYELGDTVPRDLAKALHLYCAAARAQDAEAHFRLAAMYAQGLGVPADEAIARGAYRQAATLGFELGDRLAELLGPGPVRQPPCVESDRLATVDAAHWVRTRGDVQKTHPSPVGARHITPAERQRLMELVTRLSREYKLDHRWVMAIIQTESAYNPQARSNKDARGLMQLIPETAHRFAVRNVFDPVDNLRGGMTYLRWLLAYFQGDVTLATAAYNAGERAVDRYRGVPPYAETIGYLRKVQALYPEERHPFDPSTAAPSPIFSIDANARNEQSRRRPRH